MFERLPSVVTLAPISVLAGIGMLWVFRRFSNQAAILETKRRIAASLYELRLFADEPRLVWRAQKALLAANARYLSLMVRPALVLAVPMGMLLVQMDAFYGQSPLAVGEASIVTVQLKGETSAAPHLEAPEPLNIESPPVRVLSERQISWRIRPARDFSGTLRVVFPDTAFEKTVEAGEGPRYLSERRESSFLRYLTHPTESRLPEGAVDWIGIPYASRRLRLLGLEFHWLVWFLLISTAAALALKRRFRVVV